MLLRKPFFIVVALMAFSALHATNRLRTYFPEGRDIVCVNGNHRYTRALYGTHTLFRLETSDRPVFATFDKGRSKNIRFVLTLKGKAYPLDSTSYCESRYQGGRRDYLLKDRNWGSGILHVTVWASFFEEGAVWAFSSEHFASPVSLTARICTVKNVKMKQNGELGIEPRSSFEASCPEQDLRTKTWNGGGTTYLRLTHPDHLTVLGVVDGKALAVREENARRQLVDRVVFNTPDPYLNTLGANLLAAADGLWDGHTWLHGCIGWRTPYAGWRAGYLGDVLGWNDRAVSHFNAYANSMLTTVPPVYPQPQQDSDQNLARGSMKWGTPIYSNGYICKLPDRKDVISHYDMNLNYIDELLWHFCYDADTTYMRRMWPVLQSHLAWEKRNFDPDNDHLYDAYCCIWASDALYYNGGAVTHSSAYNYRGNLLAARIAEIIGENPEPYRQEAEAIRKAMNARLWLEDEGHWAEYQDLMGLKRVHKSAALWSIYTPIDCGVCTSEQAFRSTLYVDSCIPHFDVADSCRTISTSDWMPYEWSTNNVAHEEVMNTALAYFEAGRRNAGYRLLKADVMDGMYMGQCPGNFGQISYYDRARGEAYRDFGDNVGISARALIAGLFGIRPDALYGQCIVQPSFPEQWDSASIRTPYLSYRFHREGNKAFYEVRQHFTKPLRIIFRLSLGEGRFKEIVGDSSASQTFVVKIPLETVSDRKKYSAPDLGKPVDDPEALKKMGLEGPSKSPGSYRFVNLSAVYNANVSDIFKQKYLSPRPPYTTLEMPVQGIGDWCTPHRSVEIDDSGLRATIRGGIFDTGTGIRFRLPQIGHNIVYTSLWDNYPDSIVVRVSGKAKSVWLMLAGSTNQMQSRIDNGLVIASYRDGTTDTLHLENPVNWCPIESDYLIDGPAFQAATLRPYRIHLGSGFTSRDMSSKLIRHLEKAYYRTIEDGAAEMLKMPLNSGKNLKSITLRTLSNDVVIGLMGMTLED
jgi:hypothetical protein